MSITGYNLSIPVNRRLLMLANLMGEVQPASSTTAVPPTYVGPSRQQRMATPFGNLQQQLVVQAMVAGDTAAAAEGGATQPGPQLQQPLEQDLEGPEQQPKQQSPRCQKLGPAAQLDTADAAAGLCTQDRQQNQQQQQQWERQQHASENKQQQQQQQQQLQQTPLGFLLGPGFWQEVLGSAMLSPSPGPSGALNSLTDDDISNLLCEALRQAESAARQQVQELEKRL